MSVVSEVESRMREILAALSTDPDAAKDVDPALWDALTPFDNGTISREARLEAAVLGVGKAFGEYFHGQKSFVSILRVGPSTFVANKKTRRKPTR